MSSSTSSVPLLHDREAAPININEEASVNFWVNALACSELELRVAVAQVGPSVQDVGNELGRAA